MIATCLAGLTLSFVSTALDQNIADYWQASFKDASFTAVALKGDQKELRKINKDFATSYKALGNAASVKMKEPFLLRMQGKEGDTEYIVFQNGAKKTYKIPRTGFKLNQDLSKSPGKRQTILDFGLIVPSLFSNYYSAEFKRVDRATNDIVFDLTYVPSLKDGTRNRIWVDPKKHFIRKREWYSQIDGRLQATFVFEDEKQVNGLWFPTKMTVRNADNNVAGVMEFRNISVNSGLELNLFSG